jgi:hypothetical protein
MTAIEAAMRTGRSVLEPIPEISPEFLLKGVTGDLLELRAALTSQILQGLRMP